MKKRWKDSLVAFVCLLLITWAMMLSAEEQNKGTEITFSTSTGTHSSGQIQDGQKTSDPNALIGSDQINLGAKERLAMQPESIPAKKFKSHGRIIEYNPDDLNDKSIFTIGDIVKVNIGSKKNVKEGTMVSIFKTGKLLTERSSLEQINYSIRRNEESEKKQQLMVNKIGEGKITTVKKNYSLMQISVAIEPVTVGDFILLKEE